MVKRSGRDDLHNSKTQMKLFTAIATAAVIGGSIVTFAPAVEAKTAPQELATTRFLTAKFCLHERQSLKSASLILKLLSYKW